MVLERRLLLSTIVTALALAAFTFSVDAQTKRRKTPVKAPVAAVPTATPSPSPQQVMTVDSGPKKNERPASSSGAAKPDAVVQLSSTSDSKYVYEFSQPNFDISKIVIEHDDVGRGTITFTKRMFSETETDPLQVSNAALERINAAYKILNFLDTNESYQYEKDYSHLGNMTFILKQGGKQRTAGFNYTMNKDARALADEYRKIGNQFIWIFDITVARENQPLESPKLLDSLDALMRRSEISDAEQMVPLLKELGNDERLPLIARNHAGRLVQKIEKTKKGN